MTIVIKSKQDIDKMRIAGQLTAEVLRMIAEHVRVGVTTDELVVTGDWAIERHTEFQVSTFGDSAEPVSLYFKGVWIFRRQDDGSWKIARYIWNENIPPS